MRIRSSVSLWLVVAALCSLSAQTRPASAEYVWIAYGSSQRLNRRQKMFVRNMENAAHLLKDSAAPLAQEYRRYLDGIRRLKSLDKLISINAWANRKIRHESDLKHWHKAEIWSDAIVTLREGRGDCEDYAIVKAMGAAYSGVRTRNLYLVMGLLRSHHQWKGHTILLFEYKPHNYFRFDSIASDRIQFPRPDYIPLFALSTTGVWKINPRVPAAKPPLLSSGRPVLDGLNVPACQA